MGGQISMTICNCSNGPQTFTAYNGDDGEMSLGVLGYSEISLVKNQCRTMKCSDDENFCRMWVGDLCSHCRNPRTSSSLHTTITSGETKSLRGKNSVRWVDGKECGGRRLGEEKVLELKEDAGIGDEDFSLGVEVPLELLDMEGKGININ